MGNIIKNKSIGILGSLAGTCVLATVAFANPAMLPKHDGYPMKESKSPVSGVPTANDPGKENMYGQKALEAATKTEDQGQNQMRGQDHMKGQSQSGMGSGTSGGQSQSGMGSGTSGGQSQSGMGSGTSGGQSQSSGQSPHSPQGSR